MGRGLYGHGLRALSLLAVMLVPCIASAALGGNASTIDTDVTQLKAQHAVTTSAAFSVHELQLSGGSQVREYVTSANQVFAIVWKGPSIPDMQQLLGTYFPRFSKAAQAVGHTRRPVSVEDSDLVIRTGGHPRGFFGIAYLPALMPQGVHLDQLR
jgi:uncharacterized protein DUF2844